MPDPCPNCRRVRRLMNRAKAEVARLAIDAAARGAGYGVLIVGPDAMPQLLAMGVANPAMAEAAALRGYHVRVDEIFHLLAALPMRTPHHGGIQAVVRQLCAQPPAGHVHVACVLDSDVAVATLPADPEFAAGVAEQEDFFMAEETLLRAGEPLIRSISARGINRGHVVLVAAPASSEAAALSGGVLGEALARGVYVADHAVQDVLDVLSTEGFSEEELQMRWRRFSRDVPRGRFLVVVSLGKRGASSFTVPPWDLVDQIRGE